MAIIWGFAAALSFGISDYIARGASRREGSVKTLLFLQVVGVPAAGLLVIARGVQTGPGVLSGLGAAAMGVGLVIAAGTVCLYRALAVGPVLITAPLASSFAAVTVVLSLLAGERPEQTQLVGLVVTMAGVALAAYPARASATESTLTLREQTAAMVPPGVWYAMGAATLHGLGLWLLRFIVPVLGTETTVLLMRVTALVSLVIYFAVRQTAMALRYASSLKWLLPVGVLDTLGNWFYGLGIDTGLTSVVSVITSLLSVVTVVLGVVLLHERLATIRWVGVAMTFGGVALVSA